MAASWVQERIRGLFNQLTVGCGNPQCVNINCASSGDFRHRGISNNQAAAIALQLLQQGDLPCSSSSVDKPGSSSQQLEFAEPILQSGNSSSSVPSAATSSGVRADVNRVRVSESPLDSWRLPNASTTTTTATADRRVSASVLSQPNDSSVANTNTAGASDSNPVSFSPDSRVSSNLTPFLSNFLTRISNLARPSEDEDDAASLRDLADFPQLASFSFTPASEDAHSSTNDGTTGDSNSDDHRSLKDLLERLKKIDPDKVGEAICRMRGLTLNELGDCLEECRRTEQWTSLTILVESVFTSFPALATSFPLATVDTLSPETAPIEGGPTLLSFPDAASKDNDSNIFGADSAVDMAMQVDTDSGTQASQPEKSLVSPVTSSSKFTVRADPVDILAINRAYEMMLSVPSEVGMIGVLTRAISHLIMTKLRFSIAAVPQAALLQEQPDPSSPEENMQLSVVNVFTILFACPLVTDPLYFENVLPLICRATTWLPIPIHARICHTWVEHTRLLSTTIVDKSGDQGMSESTLPSTGALTNASLIDLQKILMQQITLRCLTLDTDSIPNDDRQIREAARVLRIIFYASLILGGLDPAEQLVREANENAKLESTLFSLHRSSERRNSWQDPLGACLKVHINDCRQPWIPADEFINETLNDVINPEKDYTCYHSPVSMDKLSFMELPFLLQTTVKSVQLFYDNRLRMLSARRNAFFQSFFDHEPEMPFFKLRVSRERVVEDALVVLELTRTENPRDLQKQLFVEFDGEQGIDEGGLSKEFFQLIVQRIFNPDYGMFIFDEETQSFWFNPSPMDDLDSEYRLIGTILGLAIYNHIILDVHLPSVLYRKLVGKLGTFEDLKQGWPTLAHGLQEMLNYEEDNFEDVFCNNFVISYKDMFGNIVTNDLTPGGSTRLVTKQNRGEFVKLTADYMLNTSIKRQFAAFRQGFFLVIGESPLFAIFTPTEIELLVRGSQDYNFSELERVTEYDGSYTAESPVIRHFWSVVHSLSEEKQRHLLQFATGSDRIPVGGMTKLKFVIARQGPDSDRLPSAHTCFNVLLLPEYSSREKLERCLVTAIAYSKGFGMF